jgi:hypothetical protein
MIKALKNKVFASAIIGVVAAASIAVLPAAASADYGHGNPPTYRTYYPNGYSYTNYVPGISIPGHPYIPTPYIPAPPVWSLPPRYSGSPAPTDYPWLHNPQPLPWGSQNQPWNGQGQSWNGHH